MSGEVEMCGKEVKNYIFSRMLQTSEHENLQFVSENVKESTEDLKR